MHTDQWAADYMPGKLFRIDKHGQRPTLWERNKNKNWVTLVPRTLLLLHIPWFGVPHFILFCYGGPKCQISFHLMALKKYDFIPYRFPLRVQ